MLSPGIQAVKKAKILSPAKINWHLDVGGVRPDGFHEILSVFQSVALYDRMVLELIRGEGECYIEGDFPCRAEDNLIFKAVSLFRAQTGFDQSVRVSVDKKIPYEAGLGGGSSNAAATLKAMNALAGERLTDIQLKELAACLGSDVPFFLYAPAAAVSGRGEVVEPLQPRQDFTIVLTKPEGLGISTAQAYRAVDSWKKDNPGILTSLSKEEMIRRYLEESPAGWGYFNTFFETFKKQYKPLEFISNLLYDSGAVIAGLSGSGSAVFGLFESDGKAGQAQSRLKGYFPFVERIISINSNPPVYVI